MLKRIKQIITNAVLALALVAPLAAPVAVSAQADIQGELDAGTCLNTACPPEDPEEEISGLIEDVVNILSLIVGTVCVIMIIIGGFKYVTSNGDSNNVSSAKNTILYAIIGLVIVALSQFIVRFVLARVTD